MSKNGISQKILNFYLQRYQEMAGYQKPESYPALSEMLSYLSLLSDTVFGFYAFLREPLRGRFSLPQQKELISRCMEEGTAYAKQLQDQFDGCKPSEIAHSMGIQIQHPFKSASGERILFAEFEEPATIRVFQSAVSKARSTIAEHHLENFFQGVDIEEVLIAHELFHRIESERKESIFTINYEICLWKLGPYRHKSHLTVLSEISAMAFAKYLSGLSFSPYLFDVFLAYAYNPDAGGSLFCEIRQLAESLSDSPLVPTRN